MEASKVVPPVSFITCPSCKGKGHVYDAASLFFVGVGWIMGLFERNDSRGVTRKRCGQCCGRGYTYGIDPNIKAKP